MAKNLVLVVVSVSVSKVVKCHSIVNCHVVASITSISKKLEGDVVSREALIAAGLIRDNKQGVKLLGDGEVSRAYTVTVCKVSAAAKSAIEAAGGKIVEAATATVETKEEA